MANDLNPESNSSFCVLPFIHMNTTTGGLYRYCCIMDQPARDGEGKAITLYGNQLEDAWNSKEMASIRLKMLKGEKVRQCQKCYYEESHGSRSLRKDYTEEWLKSESATIRARTEEALAHDGILKSRPIFVELKFGNLCNIKCRMCSPFDSSMVQKEYEKISSENEDFSSIWTHRDQVMFNEEVKISELPQWHKIEGKVEQFFALIPVLQKIHFAGGEPTLHDEFYEFLNKAVESGHAKNIELSFNTNLTQVRQSVLDLAQHFKVVHVHASIDGFGEVQEYIRFPSKWPQIAENLEKLIRVGPHLKVVVAPTIQIYNVTEIFKLFDYLLELNKRTGNEINITPNILDNPRFLDIRILPFEYRQKVAKKWRDYAETLNLTTPWFKERILTVASVIEDVSVKINYSIILEFFVHTMALDKNRGQEFKTLYPELYHVLIEALKEDQRVNSIEMGNTVRLIKDGLYYDHRPETVIAKKINSFKGWTCSVGVNGLFIDWSGEVLPGTCMTDRKYSYGNIATEFDLSEKWTVCDRDLCHCNLEIGLPKYGPKSNRETATQTLMLPIHKSPVPLYEADAVVPALAWDRTSKYIMWALGRRCNYSCSYCDDHSHSKTEPFFTREALFNTIEKFQEQFSKGKRIRYAFTGGEPTLHPDFMDLVKQLHTWGHFVGITTNGSRNAEYYVEMMRYATICFSLHFEFLRKDRFLKIMEAIISDKTFNPQTAQRWVDVRFMIKPGGFQEAKEFLAQLQAIKGFDKFIYYSFVPIRTANTNTLMPYTQEELDLIQTEMTK